MAPQVDDNGNKLTDEQQKAIADHSKISADVIAKADTWIKTFTTITPQNSAQVFDKLNAMAEKPYLSDAFKKA